MRTKQQETTLFENKCAYCISGRQGCNQKAKSDSDTTATVPQATREAPLPALGLLLCLAPSPMQKKWVCAGPEGENEAPVTFHSLCQGSKR